MVLVKMKKTQCEENGVADLIVPLHFIELIRFRSSIDGLIEPLGRKPASKAEISP